MEHPRGKLYELKRRLGWFCSTTLLNVSLESAPLQKIKRDDDPIVKEIKTAENKRIMEDREKQQRMREPDIIREIESVIMRIKGKVNMAAIGGTNTNSYQAYIAPKIVCPICGNKDPNNMIVDSLKGDSICIGIDGLGCGQVLQDHSVHEGAEKRNFEGEENRNHFGPSPDKLMPDAVNLETRLDTYVSGREKSSWKRLHQAQQNVEINLSKLENDQRHTREGYKTGKKKEAFRLMADIASNINLHESIVERAKEIFSKLRDLEEAMHKFEAAVSACLYIAFEELYLTEQKLLRDQKHSSSTSNHVFHFGDERVMKKTVVETDSSLPNKLNPLEEVRLHEKYPHDPSICTIPGVSIGKFDFQETKRWLGATLWHYLKSVAGVQMSSNDFLLALDRPMDSSSSQSSPVRRFPYHETTHMCLVLGFQILRYIDRASSGPTPPTATVQDGPPPLLPLPTSHGAMESKEMKEMEGEVEASDTLSLGNHSMNSSSFTFTQEDGLNGKGLISNGKRRFGNRPTPSFFGTTTMSNRYGKYLNTMRSVGMVPTTTMTGKRGREMQSVAKPSQDTLLMNSEVKTEVVLKESQAGKYLLKLDWKEIMKWSESGSSDFLDCFDDVPSGSKPWLMSEWTPIESYLRDCIHRRSAFDLHNKVVALLRAKEAKRMKLEDSYTMSTALRIRQLSNGKAVETELETELETESKPMDTEAIDLLEWIGDNRDEVKPSNKLVTSTWQRKKVVVPEPPTVVKSETAAHSSSSIVAEDVGPTVMDTTNPEMIANESKMSIDEEAIVVPSTMPTHPLLASTVGTNITDLPLTTEQSGPIPVSSMATTKLPASALPKYDEKQREIKVVIKKPVIKFVT